MVLQDKPANTLFKSESMVSNHSLIILFIFACLMFLPALGSFGIMDPSDGLYTEAAREMVESGNYLTPYFNYAPFLEKPILVYWLIAISYKLFGVSEFAARLPAAIAAIETTCILLFAIEDCVSRRTAFFACVVMISNLLFSVIGHLALTDMELTCFSTLAALSLFRFMNSTGKARRGFFLLTCVSLSLTCLLKGPVVVVLTLLTLTVNKVFLNVIAVPEERESGWSYIAGLNPLLAIVTIAVMTTPWYFAENWLTGGAFFQEFFVRQNLGRITGSLNHVQPFWFYVPYIAGAFVPWTFLAPIAFASMRHLFRMRRPLTRRIKLIVFCLSWSLTCFTVFSVVNTKLPTYILPGVPLAAVLCGCILDVLARLRSKWLRGYSVWCASFLGLLALAGVVAMNLSYARLKEPSGFSLFGFAAAVVILTVGMVAILLISNRSQRGFPSMTVVLIWVVTVIILTPSSLLYYFQVKHAALREIVLEAGDANLATFWRDTTAGVFYHRKKVVLVRTVADLQEFRNSAGRPHQIIVTRDLIPFLRLESRGGYLHYLRARGNYTIYDLDGPE